MTLHHYIIALLGSGAEAASKITKLGLIFASDEDVLGFEVSVDNEFLMRIGESTGYIFAEDDFILLCESGVVLEVITKSAS